MMLVTGSNGMVGSYLREIFSDEQLALTDLPEMDVTKKEQVFALVEKYSPSTVLHLAAETDVDKCETVIDHAYRVNAIGTYNVALACKKYSAEMIYISTGGVFNGQAGRVHTEFDRPDPVNVYSKAKHEGEKLVRDLLKKHYIFRAGWMIGGGRLKDKKFIGKIIELCRTKAEIEVVNDKYGSPTFARDLLAGIKKVITTGNYGLYHLVNGGACTRYEIALEIVRHLGLKVRIKPVTSERFHLPAPRAASEAMRNYKLDLMGINPMPDWRTALAEYIKEWNE